MEEHEVQRMRMGEALLADQKVVNEEFITCLMEVANANEQHCADLFEIPLALVHRLKALVVHARPDQDPVLDISTTPAPLWRVSMSTHDLRMMTTTMQPMFSAELEQYRGVVKRLNLLVLGMLIRYAGDAKAATLICDVTSPALIQEIRSTPCFTLMERAGNLGRPLIEARLSVAMIDRFFGTNDGRTASPHCRALLALTTMTKSQYRATHSGLYEEHRLQAETQQDVPKPSVRTAIDLLRPHDGALVYKLLSYRVKPSEIERYLPGRGIRVVQLERLQAQKFSLSRDERDFIPIWSNATRRLVTAAILIKQRALITLGLEPLEALVESFEFFHTTYPSFDLVTLPRLIRDVHRKVHEGQEGVDFSYCNDCEAGYIANHRSPECPTCCLASRDEMGRKRHWKNYMERVEVLAA